MTSYAVDEDTIPLLRNLPTGRGQRAAVMSKLPSTATLDDGQLDNVERIVPMEPNQ